MIIDFNRYNGGGGSASGVTPQDVQAQIDSALTPYWESGETKDYVDGAVSGISLEGYATSGDMQSAFTLIAETQQVAAAGLNQLEGRIDELSGNTPDLSAYWTSAETKTAIDEKAAKYFTKSAPTIALNAAGFQMDKGYNAFFGDESEIWLLDITNDYLSSNNTTFTDEFTIDKENKEFYLEDIPAGTYRIGVYADNQDPNDSFRVWTFNPLGDFDEQEITSTIGPEFIDGYYALLSRGEDWRYGNWFFEKDVEKFTIKYNQQNDVFDVEVIYKPTIAEVVSAYTPTANFATINGSAITNGGDIIIAQPDMSNYYTSAEVDNEIGTAIAEFVTSADVETQILSKNYVTSAQVETQIISKGYATVSQIPTVPTSNTAFTNDAGYITSADTANMVTSTSVSTIWRGTQAEYDAITTKDPNTFYIIVNN